MKHSDKILRGKFFTFDVMDFDAKNREFVLHNKLTNQTIRMSDEEFRQLHEEQSKKGLVKNSRKP